MYIHTYVSVHKYELILAWDVTASFFGFKTTPTGLSIYWTLPDTIAWDKLNTAVFVWRLGMYWAVDSPESQTFLNKTRPGLAD